MFSRQTNNLETRLADSVGVQIKLERFYCAGYRRRCCYLLEVCVLSPCLKTNLRVFFRVVKFARAFA